MSFQYLDCSTDVSAIEDGVDCFQNSLATLTEDFLMEQTPFGDLDLPTRVLSIGVSLFESPAMEEILEHSPGFRATFGTEHQAVLTMTRTNSSVAVEFNHNKYTFKVSRQGYMDYNKFVAEKLNEYVLARVSLIKAGVLIPRPDSYYLVSEHY